MVEIVTPKEAEWLIDLARTAIQEKLTKAPPSETKLLLFSKTLKEKHGLFVSLWQGNDLRGCIGTPHPPEHLEQAVKSIALRAAFHDIRFPPITDEELQKIKIEISVLTPLSLIEPNQIELGIHGVVVCQEKSSALLFPNIPVEYGWDVTTFLQQLCLKAGLPIDAWENGADLFGFQMQVCKENGTQ